MYIVSTCVLYIILTFQAEQDENDRREEAEEAAKATGGSSTFVAIDERTRLQ
jgi:hypothetical protein